MSKMFLAVVLLVCCVGSVSASTLSLFAIERSRTAGFNSCSQTIEKVFSENLGEDARIQTFTHKSDVIDEITLLSTFGSPNSNNLKVAHIRKHGPKCLAFVTTTHTYKAPCVELISTTPTSGSIAVNVGYLWETNKNGGLALLTDVSESQCSVTFYSDYSEIEPN